MSEFLQQDDQRKDRILEAALIEFADKGYKKGSTNTIVREAEVSKGLLFHYYISKKDLYILLYKHAVESINQEILASVNMADKDVLDRLEQATAAKVETYNNHPLFVKLLEHHAQVEEPEILDETKEILKQSAADYYTKLFANIDYYMFDEIVSADRSLLVIKWTIERITDDWSRENNYKISAETLDELSMDISNYLDLFRNSFYR